MRWLARRVKRVIPTKRRHEPHRPPASRGQALHQEEGVFHLMREELGTLPIDAPQRTAERNEKPLPLAAAADIQRNRASLRTRVQIASRELDDLLEKQLRHAQ